MIQIDSMSQIYSKPLLVSLMLDRLKKSGQTCNYMTDHAGPRRYECNPGTKLWRPSVEVTQFWRPFFVRHKKIKLVKRRGNSMKHKLLEMI